MVDGFDGFDVRLIGRLGQLQIDGFFRQIDIGRSDKPLAVGKGGIRRLRRDKGTAGGNNIRPDAQRFAVLSRNRGLRRGQGLIGRRSRGRVKRPNG